MIIVNPIYDVAFKFLMEDLSIAKDFLSSIIGEKILSLDIRSQEQTVRSPDISLTVVRYDFRALIETPNGNKKVLIELQKGKQHVDIQRFRRYLGKNYITADSINGKKETLPIITVYIIGFPLTIQIPVLKVSNNYENVLTHQPIIGLKDEFVEALNHECFIVQIPFLKNEKKTELEEILEVFNQKYVIKSNRRLLEIPFDNKNKIAKKIIKRLEMAMLDANVQDEMEAEVEFNESIKETLNEKEEIIKQTKKIVEETQKIVAESNKKIEEKDKKLEENNKKIEEKDKKLEEKDKKLEEKDKKLEEIDKKLEEIDKKLEEKDKKLEEKDKKLQENEKLFLEQQLIINELLKKLNQ